jgi:hypothetical protein
LRRASKGLEACSGSALLSVVARMVSKQAIEIGEMGASLAPAITTSASPSSMSWLPYPTASMPDVHPVETTVAGPCARKRTASSVAPQLGTRAWCRNREP